MLLAYISLAGGLIALIFAGDLLVRGAVSIARRLSIPNLVIGLTIVAFGTSAPELVISLEAGFKGAGGLAIGNVVGSNIANVLLVLGLPALIAATPCGEDGATRNAIFMVFVSAVFVALCFYSPLSIVAALVLLTLLGLFLYDSFKITRSHRKNCTQDDSCIEDVDDVPEVLWQALIYLALGLAGLPLAAHFTIEGASVIARSWGVSDAVIGLTVVALGTSLPELATTLMAAVRQHGGVAIGNVIGSNVFNLLAIIGITSLVVPLDVPARIVHFDIWVMMACALLLLVFAHYRLCLNKMTGFALTLAYLLYIGTVYWMAVI